MEPFGGDRGTCYVVVEVGGGEVVVVVPHPLTERVSCGSCGSG